MTKQINNSKKARRVNTSFKCLSGTGPTFIGNLFKYRPTPYGLRGDGLNLELPNFNL